MFFLIPKANKLNKFIPAYLSFQVLIMEMLEKPVYINGTNLRKIPSPKYGRVRVDFNTPLSNSLP